MQRAHPQLRHFGILVCDLSKLEAFYRRLFGLVVTGAGTGRAFKNPLLFLGRNPDQLHQLALSIVRVLRAFSAVIQISFMVAFLRSFSLFGRRPGNLARLP